jgi:hypothetical protein
MNTITLQHTNTQATIVVKLMKAIFAVAFIVSGSFNRQSSILGLMMNQRRSVRIVEWTLSLAQNPVIR